MVNIWDYAWGPVAGTPQPKASLSTIITSSLTKAAIGTLPGGIFINNPDATKRAFIEAFSAGPLMIFTRPTLPDVGGTRVTNPVPGTTADLLKQTPLKPLVDATDAFQKLLDWLGKNQNLILMGGVALVSIWAYSKIK